MKICRKCGVTKPASDFSPDKPLKDGSRPRRANCKVCCRIAHREYLARNPEQTKASSARRQAEYRDRHPERVKAAIRKWRAENQDKIKAYNQKWSSENPGKRPALTRAWAKKNRARKAELARQYAARKRGAFVLEVDEALIILRDEGQCGICNKPIMGPFHLDHIVPLVTGGTHEPDNVQLAHPFCNQSKGANS